MFSEVDVFLSNYTIVDPEIYQLWIEGYTGPEAVHYLKMKGIVEKMGVSLDLVSSDVNDHYRTYAMLERLLSSLSTSKLFEQPAFQLDPKTQQILIEKFYSLDDEVAREILGKKLSSRYRKDLDEVAEKTCVKLKSCRRQFDNVKRIYKVVDEMPGLQEHPIYMNIDKDITQSFPSRQPDPKHQAAVCIARRLGQEIRGHRVHNHNAIRDIETQVAVLDFCRLLRVFVGHDGSLDVHLPALRAGVLRH